MNQQELEANLKQITDMVAFDEVFDEMKKADPEIGSNIETALRNQLKEIHEQLESADCNKDKLKYALYRETVEINSHVSRFLRYSETMSQRETALWKFALEATDQFFDLVFDALDEYFQAKLEIMQKQIEEDSDWYTGLKDTAKKAGEIINIGKKGVRLATRKLAKVDLVDSSEVFDTRDLVKKLLDQYLNPENVQSDITKLMELASKQYQDAWMKEIQAQTPNMDEMKAIAGKGADQSGLEIGFELGTAEQALLIGMGGALVGTFGLAAGWHTITYSLLNVFPPAAIFAVIATVTVAVLAKDQAAQKRMKVIQDAVKEYHRYFLTQIDIASLDELKGLTLRKAMTEQSKKLIAEVMEKWNEAISGKLNLGHYRKLGDATNIHLGYIDDCVALMENSIP